MVLRVLLALLALSASLWLWPAAWASAPGPRQPPAHADLNALDRALAEHWRAAGVPGASVVVIEGGRVVMARDYGMADIASARPVAPDTVFRAGSISKTLTAVAIMQLVEQGRLDLEAAIKVQLPEWLVQGDDHAARPLLLTHLLEHTSGLDDIRYRHYLIEGRDTSLSQALPLFGPYRLRWAPGNGTAYSNAGPIAAGRLVEKASGAAFHDQVSRHITGPLGMDSARWMRDPAQAGVLATSYQADGRTPEPYVETPARPSGSLSATTRDLARLPLMFIGRGAVDGARVLSAASVARMEQPVTSAAARHGVPIGWGLALLADMDGRAVFYGHDGSIDGFVARFAYAPSLGAGYVVMANLSSQAALDAGQVVRRYLERTLPPPAPRVQPLTASQRQRWSGQYQSYTPRQELLRAVLGMTQWEGAGFDGEVLRFERARWQHVGAGVFQKEGASAPGLVFIDDGAEVQAHTQNGAKRRVGRAEMIVKQVVLMLAPLALLVGVLWLVAWAVQAARGKAPVAGAAWRLWPLAALCMAVGAPLSALLLLGTGDLAWLSRPNAGTLAATAASWLAPAVAAAAAVALWRRRASSVGWPLRTLALLQLVLAFAAVGWLGAHGWIGLRLWDA